MARSLGDVNSRTASTSGEQRKTLSDFSHIRPSSREWRSAYDEKGVDYEKQGLPSSVYQTLKAAQAQQTEKQGNTANITKIALIISILVLVLAFIFKPKKKSKK